MTSLSIYEGGIAPLGKYKNQMIFWQIESLLEKYDLDTQDSYRRDSGQMPCRKSSMAHWKT